jgi:hypothetical protein
MNFEELKDYIRIAQRGDNIDFYSHLTIEEKRIVFTASPDYNKAFNETMNKLTENNSNANR